MRSYRIHSTVVIEEKTAAKEKNNRLLKEYFSPLAAKINKKLLQGRPDASRGMFHVFSKRAP
jgi:hypothetical protein